MRTSGARRRERSYFGGSVALTLDVGAPNAKGAQMGVTGADSSPVRLDRTTRRTGSDRRAEPQQLDRFGWCLIGLAIVPLVVAAGYVLVHFGGAYHANNDNALNEVVVREIGERLPLLGSYSRADWSHPGPVYFYLMWFPYRAFGSNSSAMLAGALMLNAAAIGGSIAFAHRWGGRRFGLITALGFAWLVVRLPSGLLENPWNPFVTVLPFGLFLLCVWAALNGDRFALPLAGAVGTFCAQTHIGYAALVGGVLLVAVLGTLRNRKSTASNGRPFGLMPLLGLGATLAVLWAPPLIEQFIHSPGNVRNTVDYLTSGEKTKTLTDGARAVLAQFTWRPDWIVGLRTVGLLTREPVSLSSSQIPILLLPLGLALAIAWRRRMVAARNLLTLLGFVVVLGIPVVARTIGPMYEYRLRWVWVLAMLVVVSTLWTFAVLVGDGRRLSRHVTIAGTGLLVVLSCLGIGTLLAADPPSLENTRLADGLATQVKRRLPPGTGELELVGTSFESYGFVPGLMLRLGRAGYAMRVPMTDDNRLRYGPMRLTQGVAPRRLTIVANEDIEKWEGLPGLKELALVSEATRSERARAFRRLTALLKADPGATRHQPAELARLKATLAGRALFLSSPPGAIPDPIGSPTGGHDLRTAVPKAALIYGDGLVYESRFQILNRFALRPAWTVDVLAFGYFAPCDWLRFLPADLAAKHPSVVGMLTAGDTGATPCMKDAAGAPIPFGSAAYYAKYREDLDALFAAITAAGAKVVFFSAPPFSNPARTVATERITSIATELASRYRGVSIAGSVRTALSDHQLYTTKQACLATETSAMGCDASGLIAVRTLPGLFDAGLHLCPTGLQPGTGGVCSVYSSGEFRLARAMTDTLVAR